MFEKCAEVEITSQINQTNTMSYLDEIDVWLETLIFGGPNDNEPVEQWTSRVKKEVKAKLLQSYRNGQKAGPRTTRKGLKPRGIEAPTNGRPRVQRRTLPIPAEPKQLPE